MVSNFGLVMTLNFAENGPVDLMTCRYIITILPQESELKCCGM